MWKKSKIMGVSVAASWAWGTSLIVGMEIAQQRGLLAWLIWAVANASTLALFGWLYETRRIPAIIYSRRWVKTVGIIIQLFCLVIQLNAIAVVMGRLGLGHWSSYALSSAIGIVAVLAMYKGGLRTSVKTDVLQWAIMLGAIILIFAVNAFNGFPTVQLPVGGGKDILWGVWSACILLSAPIGDVQHWQRARAMDGRAYLVGAAWFALYMALVLAMACLKFVPAMNVALLIAVLCVATSTMDSIATALHEAGGKKVGTAIALAMCVLWGITIEMGILNIWSKFGVVRVCFALAILWASYSFREQEVLENEHY